MPKIIVCIIITKSRDTVAHLDVMNLIQGQIIPAIIFENGLQGQLNELMDTINETMHKTGQPPCPLNIVTFSMFPLCCLSPVFCMEQRNHKKRIKIINDAKQKFNEIYGKFDSARTKFNNGLSIKKFLLTTNLNSRPY